MKAWLPSTMMVSLVLAGCVSRDTVATAPSPSGKIKAILVETNGGATTSFGYEVRLRGSAFFDREIVVASAYGAVRNENAYGVNLVWHGENALEIQYWQARAVRLERSSVVIDGTSISVTFKGGVMDSSAPAGGMLYNLQGKR